MMRKFYVIVEVSFTAWKLLLSLKQGAVCNITRVLMGRESSLAERRAPCIYLRVVETETKGEFQLSHTFYNDTLVTPPSGH